MNRNSNNEKKRQTYTNTSSIAKANKKKTKKQTNKHSTLACLHFKYIIYIKHTQPTYSIQAYTEITICTPPPPNATILKFYPHWSEWNHDKSSYKINIMFWFIDFVFGLRRQTITITILSIVFFPRNITHPFIHDDKLCVQKKRMKKTDEQK